MNIVELPLNDVACTGCVGKIRRRLNQYNGIDKVTILSGSGKIRIKYNVDLIRVEEIQHNLHKAALRTFD